MAWKIPNLPQLEPLSRQALEWVARRFPLQLSTDNFTDAALTVLNEDGDRASRIVWGVVNANGTVGEAGTGDWTPTKNATGDYTIAFNPDFAGVPAVTFGVEFSGAGTRTINYESGPTAAGFDAELRDQGSVNQDHRWHFIAIGPR